MAVLGLSLCADVGEEAWSCLWETGRIAVTVVDHLGGEVMKVLELLTAAR